MDFKKKDAPNVTDKEEQPPRAAPVPPPPPPALVSVPVQGTIIPSPEGKTLGVVCGYGWVAEKGGMRPVVLIAIRTGGIAVLPAELANTVGDDKEESVLVAPV